jgi:hypothetical protein
MLGLFIQLLNRLGSPKEQQSESVALTIIYCMFLSFSMVLFAMLLIL